MEKNYRILLIIEIINKYLPEDMQISGYYNYFDENEIAFINRDGLIIDLIESKYKTINYYHFGDEDRSELLSLNFPVSRDIFKSELSLKVAYSDYFGDNLKFRMYCSPL